MIGFGKYLEKLYEVRWDFDPSLKNEIEGMLCVRFKKDNENKYFVIENVLYTYVDILLGLEDLNFVFTKENEDGVIKIY